MMFEHSPEEAAEAQLDAEDRVAAMHMFYMALVRALN